MSVDVVGIGECMLLLSTEPGRPVQSTPSLDVSVAGSESNVMIGLSRLGYSATWIGRVGADAFGNRVVNALRGEGVKVVAARDDGAPTGVMFKELAISGTAVVRYYRHGGAATSLGPRDVDVEAVRSARLLHVSGITPALGAEPRKAIEYAIDVAQSASTLVAFDVNYREALWTRAEASNVLSSILARADITFGSVDELNLFAAGSDPVALSEAIACGGPGQVIVKSGAQGVVAREGGEVVEGRAIPAHVVDEVGAGDAFVAGYLSGVLAHLTLSQRVDRGLFMASRVIQCLGDWEGLPSREDVVAFEGEYSRPRGAAMV